MDKHVSFLQKLTAVCSFPRVASTSFIFHASSTAQSTSSKGPRSSSSRLINAQTERDHPLIVSPQTVLVRPSRNQLPEEKTSQRSQIKSFDVFSNCRQFLSSIPSRWNLLRRPPWSSRTPCEKSLSCRRVPGVSWCARCCRPPTLRCGQNAK